jgi:predicted nucleotidyltransferase
VRDWADRIAATRREVRRIGYFGSYARGDWGVGSDLDILVIVDRAEERRDRRALALDVSDLPVPAEVLVYTEDEWRALVSGGARFGSMLARETVWVR